jgi:signal transduction histidine kinase
MSDQRWWHIAFGGSMLVLAVLNAFTDTPTPSHRIVAWITIGLLTIAYALIGRAALATGRFAVTFSVVLIAGSGVVVAVSPALAIIQAIAFPVLWSVIQSTRWSIVANFALALSVGIGFIVALGVSSDNVTQTFLIEGVSLVGSLALGLWITRIAELSCGRQRLLDELTQAQDELAALNRETGISSERQRLAREIHDTIAQDLTGLTMLAQRSRRELEVGNTSAALDQLELLEDNARNALAETRALVAASVPVDLANGGISDALERLAARFTRETGVTVTAEVEIEIEAIHPLGRDTEVVLLRIAQEGLANIRKHSQAHTAVISLASLEGSATLTVRDDGTGFETGAPATGFGLGGMRDRLALVGGSLDVVSALGNGTALVATLPVSASVATP